jgi:autotransporter passenger strand-loop-strand repeat protein
MTVSSGSTVFSASVAGFLGILSRGTDSGTVISNGGLEVVSSGGTASNTTLNGGEQDVYGSASGTVVNSGGLQVVESGGTGSGTTIGNGGTEYVSAGGTAQDVTFGGTAATLDLEDPSGLAGTISNWQVGETIDFKNTSVTSASIGGSTLTVTTSGGQSFAYQLSGQQAHTDADLQSDGAGGTALTLDVEPPPTLSVAVSGLVQEGQTLTATPTLGTDGDNTTADVTYQWQRNGNNIGATGSTYVLTEADEGKNIRVRASFTDNTGQPVSVSSPNVNVADPYLWGSFQLTPPVAGTSVSEAAVDDNINFGLADVLYGTTPNFNPTGAPNGPIALTYNLAKYDQFFLADGSQIVAGPLTQALPYQYSNIDLSTASNQFDGLGFIQTTSGGNNILSSFTVTPTPGGGFIVGSPSQIENAGTSQIIALRNPVQNSSGPTSTSYGLAWGEWDGASNFSIKFQIFNPDGSPSSPVVTADSFTGVASPSDAPGFALRPDSGTGYVLEVAQSSPTTNVGQAYIHVQGYTAAGATNGVSFDIQPDLSAFSGAGPVTSQINDRSDPIQGTDNTAALAQFTNGNNNNDYALAWNETVHNDNGTFDQVEFALAQPVGNGASIVAQHAFAHTERGASEPHEAISPTGRSEKGRDSGLWRQHRNDHREVRQRRQRDWHL